MAIPIKHIWKHVSISIICFYDVKIGELGARTQDYLIWLMKGGAKSSPASKKGIMIDNTDNMNLKKRALSLKINYL